MKNYVTPEWDIIRFSIEERMLSSEIEPNETEGYEMGQASIEWELD